MENQAVKKSMILVVESDPLMLTGIAAVLDREGYRCFLSRDLSIAQKATDTMAFDLLILSIEGDVLAAQQMAIQLRSNPLIREVPILFLGGKFEEGWREILSSVGGIYCLEKPLDPKVLIEIVAQAVWLPYLSQARISPPKAHFLEDWVRL